MKRERNVGQSIDKRRRMLLGGNQEGKVRKRACWDTKRVCESESLRGRDARAVGGIG